MTRDSSGDAWREGQSYDLYMGRWSALIAERFLPWLDPPAEADWVEVGCGTGALSRAVLQQARPRSLLGLDRSEDFIAVARDQTDDPRARFDIGDALDLPLPDGSVDVATSALMLNFLPDMAQGLREMQRVLRRGGLLCFYVWDYPGGGMGLIDRFWRTAEKVFPTAAELNESRRFPRCTEAGLRRLCAEVGLPDCSVTAIERSSEFPDFESFWHPFTLRAGPAPGYVASLSPKDLGLLREALAQDVGPERPITLPARVWAVRARLPTA